MQTWTLWEARLHSPTHLKIRMFSMHHYYCDDTQASCSEIVCEIIARLGKQIARTSAKALLLGIITDTGRFKRSTIQSMKSFISLAESYDISMDEVYTYLSKEIPQSQTMAQIKACHRLQFEQYRGVFIGSSVVSAFEGGAAASLLSIGLNVCLVGSQRDSEFRVSGRADASAMVQGIHLGRIFDAVSETLGGKGGGHDGAASLSGTGDVEAALNICKSHIKQALDGSQSAEK